MVQELMCGVVGMIEEEGAGVMVAGAGGEAEGEAEAVGEGVERGRGRVDGVKQFIAYTCISPMTFVLILLPSVQNKKHHAQYGTHAGTIGLHCA